MLKCVKQKNGGYTLTDIKKAAASGILISIGGCVLLASTKSGMMWAGAVLFSLGLFAICEYGFNLYTGKVGYIAEHFKDFKYIRLVLLILVVNLLTTFIMGILVSFCLPDIAESARASYASKLAADPKKWVLSSILCGLLMYLAVDLWKRGQKIGVFLCVPVFIFSGFDHSIANSFYNGAAIGEQTFTFRNLAFVVVVVLGNALGGMILPMLTRKWRKTSES